MFIRLGCSLKLFAFEYFDKILPMSYTPNNNSYT